MRELPLFLRLLPRVMDAPSHLGLRIIALGLGIGLAGQALFFSTGLGINVLLWAIVLIGAAAVAIRWPVPNRRKSDLTYAAALIAGAVGIALNDSPWVVSLNVALILGTFGLYAYSTGSSSKRTGGLSQLLVMAACAWAQFWLEAFKVGRDVDWAELRPQNGHSQSLRSVGRGLALAVPAMIVFLILMTSADPIFGRLLTPHVQVDADAVVGRTLLTLLMGMFGMGYLRRTVWARVSPPVVENVPEQAPARLGWIEFSTVFAMLSLLLVGFVLVQGRYLFGGTDVVMATEGMSYATYARRGFFELVTLVAISVPILLGATGMLRLESIGESRVVKGLSFAFLGLVSLVLVSAGRRMQLYVDAYGLSELRFYVSISMLWLGLLLALVAGAIGRERMSRLPRSLGWSVALAIGAVSMANPDRLIAEFNLNRTSGEVVLDHTYLAGLGGGSVPSLLRALPNLPPEQRTSIWRELNSRYAAKDRDWRDWNYLQAQAQESFQRAARTAQLSD